MDEMPRLRLLRASSLPHGLRRAPVRELKRRARELGQCCLLGRRTYVTPAQLAAIVESYRWVAQHPFRPVLNKSGGAARVLSPTDRKKFQLALRRLAKEQKRRDKENAPATGDEPALHQDAPPLHLLVPELISHDLTLSARTLRVRARKIGACQVIGRKVFVSTEQLATIIESYRVPAKPPRKIDFAREIRGPITPWLAADEAKQYEKARKLLAGMKPKKKR